MNFRVYIFLAFALLSSDVRSQDPNLVQALRIRCVEATRSLVWVFRPSSAKAKSYILKATESAVGPRSVERSWDSILVDERIGIAGQLQRGLTRSATTSLLELRGNLGITNALPWPHTYRTFQAPDGLERASQRFGLRPDQIHADPASGAVGFIEFWPIEKSTFRVLDSSETGALEKMADEMNAGKFRISPVGKKGAHKISFLTGVMADYDSGPEIKKPLEREFQGLRRLFFDVYRPGMSGGGLITLNYVFESKAQAEAFRDDLGTLDSQRFFDASYVFVDVSRLAGKYASTKNPRVMLTPAEEKLIRQPVEHGDGYSYQTVRRDMPTESAIYVQRQLQRDMLWKVEPIGGGKAVRVPIAAVIEQADGQLGWRSKIPRKDENGASGEHYDVKGTGQKVGETRIAITYQVYPNAKVAEEAIATYRQRLIDSLDSKLFQDVVNLKSGTEASHRLNRVLETLEAEKRSQ